MVCTVILTPTPMYPDRRATIVRTDRNGGRVTASVEVTQQHPPPDGRLVTRFVMKEETPPRAVGDRMFAFDRPGFAGSEWACLPADAREFPMCSCKKWRDKAWCLHVEVLRAFAAEKALDPQPA